MKDKKGKKSIWKKLVFAGITLVLSGQLISVALDAKNGKPERIPYREYQEMLENGEIDVIYYDNDSEYMTIALGYEATENLTEEQLEKFDFPNSQLREVLFPDNEDFRKEILEAGVIVQNGSDSHSVTWYLDRYGSLIIYIALITVMVIVLKQNNPANAKGFATAVSPNDLEVTFDDVIGHEEIKGDLKLLVKQMKNGAKMKDISHGVLFEGGAGTGKTMLAKAIAKEAGVNFISVNSSNLVEMYVGLGARRVRDAFKKAKEAAPCVLFFDEVDAIGAKRGSQHSHKENDQTINALLTEMDGFQTGGEILVIAATNRADDLDDALVRAGRFDRKVKIEAPKKWETRKQLFDHYLKDRQPSEDVDTEILAKQTVNFSGADIAAIVREAQLISLRDELDAINQNCLEEAIDKIVFKGNRSDEEQHEKDVQIVAYHEAGHAVARLATGNEVSRISIMSMTSGVGGAVFGSDNDRQFISKKEVRQNVEICYAGRASEEVFFGSDKITQGASNDISQATSMLYNYIAKFGFGTSEGQSVLVDYETLSKAGINSDERITKSIEAESSEIYQETLTLIRHNKDSVERLAKKLLEVKTMDGNEVAELLKLEGEPT